MATTKNKQDPIDEAIKYAEHLEPYSAEHGGAGFSKNEERIIILAKEVKRLRKLVPRK